MEKKINIIKNIIFLSSLFLVSCATFQPFVSFQINKNYLSNMTCTFQISDKNMMLWINK